MALAGALIVESPSKLQKDAIKLSVLYIGAFPHFASNSLFVDSLPDAVGELLSFDSAAALFVTSRLSGFRSFALRIISIPSGTLVHIYIITAEEIPIYMQRASFKFRSS
jgi:hypothetical protein